jgi:FHA domain/Bacterial Ig-like domain (group 1)
MFGWHHRASGRIVRDGGSRRCHGARWLVLALTVVTGAVLSASSRSALPTSASSGVEVSVGYADNTRLSPVSFPTPWNGSPNLIFEGCAASSCSFDSGAVMVFNNTPAEVMVNSIEIDVDTCHFSIWPPNVSLPAGEELIATQTVSGVTAGCPSLMTGLMDTSDIGPGGIDYSLHCITDGIVPIVRMTIDGSTTAYPDRGQILNTGGLDKGGCPSGTDESTQWTEIGSSPCPGALLSLKSDSAATGMTAGVQATLTNNCGTPLPNVNVAFSVLSGQNAGLTGSATTNGSGQATFSYAGSSHDTDTMQASVTNPAGTFTSNTVLLQANSTSASGSLKLILIPLLAAALAGTVALVGGVVFLRRRRRLAPVTAYAGPPTSPALPADAFEQAAAPPPIRERGPRATLTVSSKSDSTKQQVVELGGDPLIIGRSPECDVVLVGSYVGQQHARIWLRDDTFNLQMLATEGRMAIGGKAVHSAVLANGDEIEIGWYRLRFELLNS